MAITRPKEISWFKLQDLLMQIHTAVWKNPLHVPNRIFDPELARLMDPTKFNVTWHDWEIETNISEDTKRRLVTHTYRLRRNGSRKPCPTSVFSDFANVVIKLLKSLDPECYVLENTPSKIQITMAYPDPYATIQ